MNSVIFLMATSIVGFADPTIDKASFTRVLEAVYAPLEDVTCEYEGTMRFPQSREKDLGPDGLYDEFSGVYVGRHDGAVLIDIFHRHYPERRLYRETIGMIAGKYEEYARASDARDGGGEINSAHFLRPERLGSLSRIMGDRLVMGYLRSEDWAMSHKGFEVVAGHRCELVTFTYNKNSDLSERIWIDLERGGHALRRESIHQGTHVSNSVSDIVLHVFKDDQGHT